jgi:hypothetical protein
MPPGQLDLHVRKGDDLSHRIEFFEADETTPRAGMDSNTYAAQVKLDPTSGSADMVITINTSEAASGVLTLEASNTLTDALTADAEYLWDLQEDDAGAVTTLLAGRVYVSQDVTR